MTTIFESLTARTRELGDRPAVTFVDAGTGERTELSFATLHNWVSKTANLLGDSFDVQLGSEVRLDVPLHWMVPVIAVGAWATGAAVRLERGGDVVIGHELDASTGGVGTDADLLIGIGMGGRPTTPDVGDALTVTDVLAQPDEFVDDPQDEDAWVMDGRTQATVLADPLGVAGTRILHAGDRTTSETVFALARSLPAGVGVILARGLDGEGLDRLAVQEGLGP